MEKIKQAVLNRKDDLINAMVEEFGGTLQISTSMIEEIENSISTIINVLKSFDFDRKLGKSRVLLEPVGVAGIITPWNASNTFICNKLSTAIAAGCTSVIKPSEMSVLQTQVLIECLNRCSYTFNYLTKNIWC